MYFYKWGKLGVHSVDEQLWRDWIGRWRRRLEICHKVIAEEHRTLWNEFSLTFAMVFIWLNIIPENNVFMSLSMYLDKLFFRNMKLSNTLKLNFASNFHISSLKYHLRVKKITWAPFNVSPWRYYMLQVCYKSTMTTMCPKRIERPWFYLFLQHFKQ